MRGDRTVPGGGRRQRDGGGQPGGARAVVRLGRAERPAGGTAVHRGGGAGDRRAGIPVADADTGPGVGGAAVAGVRARRRGRRRPAIFSFPLQIGAIEVGTLSLYRAKPGPPTAGELADVLVFADIALRLLLDGASGI